MYTLHFLQDLQHGVPALTFWTHLSVCTVVVPSGYVDLWFTPDRCEICHCCPGADIHSTSRLAQPTQSDQRLWRGST